MLYTTIECVNIFCFNVCLMCLYYVCTLYTASNMLNVCIVVHDNRMCEHAYYTNHLYA